MANNIRPTPVLVKRYAVLANVEESDLEESDYEDCDVESACDSDQICDSSSESSDGPPEDAAGWTKLSDEGVSCPRFVFTGSAGVHFDFVSDDEGGLLQYFEKFMDDDTITMMVDETNRYAAQCGATTWKPVTPDEMKVFLGTIFLQSVIQKSDLQMYWSKDQMVETPFFQKIMSDKRFCKIKQYLHFADNEEFDPGTHPNPKLNKIWPVCCKFLENCQSLYTPSQDVTIDESLMMYKGRLGWVQYIPLKRARFGIKFFMLCESSSGYAYDFIIYTGATSVFDPEFESLPVSSQVVMTLMKPLLNQGYCLIVDNYYTSPELADILVSNNTDIYGTLRLNQKELPVGMKQEKLRKGEISAYTRGKLLALKWKDKKDVSLLSSIHNAEMVDVATRTGNIKKPKVVMDYNNTMGGVDRVDQHLATYPTTRKRGKKYYKKIFLHILDLAMWNAFILYTKLGGTQSSLSFRMNMIREIFQKYHTP